MRNVKPLIFDSDNNIIGNIKHTDTLVIPKDDDEFYSVLSNLPRFSVVDSTMATPTDDGYYLFAGEPIGGLPTGITTAGGIAVLTGATWKQVFSINQIPDIAIEYNGGSWIKNATSDGWMAYKQINDELTNTTTLWSSAQISNYVTQALLNAPSLPAVKCATTTNDSLSGLAARDGYTPVAGDVILVKNQTNNDNGFWIAASGAWARAKYNKTSKIFEAITTETTYSQLNIQGGIVNVLNGTTNKNLQLQINIATDASTFGNSIVYVTQTTKIPLSGSNTRYIDAGSGNDSYNGSSAFPFATLLAAYNSPGLSFPATFFLPSSGAALSSPLTHISGKSNLGIVTLDHTQKGGKTSITGVQTFASGNTRVTFKGMAFSTGSSTPFVFQTGNLYRHELENVSFSGAFTSLMSIAADASNWITIRNCDFTGAPSATLPLPNLTNAFTLNIYSQHSRLPISGTGGANTVINIYNSDEYNVRVYPTYIGKINWMGKQFGFPVGSSALPGGLITSQTQLDTVLAWTADGAYDGYYAISGFIPTAGNFSNGAIFGKQTASGVATEVFWGRTFAQSPASLSTISGTILIKDGNGGWSANPSNGSFNVPDWTQSSTYKLNDLRRYTDGILYLANGTIAANTAFTVGTTGATWSQLLVNASNLSSGTVPLARLGTGTPTASKFLRGDNVWAEPSVGAIPVWTNAGTVNAYIGSTTTSPTIGTTRRNQYLYRMIGVKEMQVSMVLDVAGTGSANGSGDYLFTLPNGAQFDTSIQIQTPYSSGVGANDNSFPRYAIPGGSAWFYYNNATTNWQVQPIVYDSTRFRIVIFASGIGVKCWSSSWYGITLPTSVQLNFSVQIA